MPSNEYLDRPISSFEFQNEESDYLCFDQTRTWYLEGKQSMKDGIDLDDCPYEDEHKIAIWKMGWQSATIGMNRKG